MPERLALPQSFRIRPFAHRGLHDVSRGIAENSRAGFAAAITGGYGIETDLQLSADGEAMVFHDHDLRRLTGRLGPVRGLSSRVLGQIGLSVGGEAMPTLAEMLALVAGRVPLLIEIKDQDGALGPNVGALERRAAELLAAYGGDVAVMSFNPYAVAVFAADASQVPVGLTTCDFKALEWPMVAEARRLELAKMVDLGRVGASFISHDKADLRTKAVAKAKADGLAVLCWTIRSAEQEHQARLIADNITFEGYAA